MAAKLFSALGAKVFAGLALALLLAAGGLALWARAESARADKWQAHSALEASNHRQTKDRYRAAQAEAKAKAAAAREADESHLAQIAKENDDANDEADRWEALARRYADAGGLRDNAGTGAGSSGGTAGAANPDHVAESGDRPGDASILLSRADFDALILCPPRLLKVHSWGEDLIRDGFAVAMPAPKEN